MFTISAKLLHQVSAFRAQDSEVRYYLSGVHVERDAAGRVLLVATDGHRLIAAHDATAFWAFKGGDAFTIDFKTPGFKQALTRAAKSDLSRVQWDGLNLEVLEKPKGGHKDAMVSTYQVPSGHAAMIDGRFPDWRRVIPPAKDLVLGCVARFNLELLEGLERFGLKYGLPMDIYTTGDTSKAFVVRIPHAPHVVAVIMPMGRGTASDIAGLTALPDFTAGKCHQEPAKEPDPVMPEPEEDPAPPVQAQASADVAAWIDPKGELRAAGLLVVVPVTA